MIRLYIVAGSSPQIKAIQVALNQSARIMALNGHDYVTGFPAPMRQTIRSQFASVQVENGLAKVIALEESEAHCLGLQVVLNRFNFLRHQRHRILQPLQQLLPIPRAKPSEIHANVVCQLQ